ncbi:MAG: hypothetical protein KDB22_14965 [Planctomycetales bacterium]|nr:hypothetical protein [Planctomycetales bacterium]
MDKRILRFPILRLLTCFTLAAALMTSQTLAQPARNSPQAVELKHDLIADAVVKRLQNRLIVAPKQLSDSGSVSIPRFFASLKSLQWQGHDEPAAISFVPEQEHWRISWKERPAGAERIVLRFDQPPLLAHELKLVTASGDGSFWLPAYMAHTTGEKVRYEPQPHKNTVGYWVGAQDLARWNLQIDEPGDFNVAILQGCGQGQGGSSAEISLQLGQSAVSNLKFQVAETGHFQNFQWRHVGTVSIQHPGEHVLQIAPITISRNALMDVRAVHLIRLPRAN